MFNILFAARTNTDDYYDYSYEDYSGDTDQGMNPGVLKDQRGYIHEQDYVTSDVVYVEQSTTPAPAPLDLGTIVRSVFLDDGRLHASLTWRLPDDHHVPMFTVHWRRVDCDVTDSNSTCQLPADDVTRLVIVTGNEVYITLFH